MIKRNILPECIQSSGNLAMKRYSRKYRKYSCTSLLLICFIVYFILLPLLQHNEDTYSYVFSELNESWEQSDKDLSEYIKQHILIPPTNKPFIMPVEKEAAKISQFGIENLLETLLKKQIGGIFVEAGAFDGVNLSNTLYLEQVYNWTGLLIEGHPDISNKLIASGRQAWVAPVLLSPTSTPSRVLFNKFGAFSYVQPLDDIIRSYNCGDRVLHGLSNKKIESYKSKLDCIPMDNRQEVMTIPLYALLKAAGLTNIDFFSLDVEGAEMSVLYNLPFDKVNIKMFLIEANRIEGEVLEEFMASKGYEEIESFGGINIREIIPIDLLFVKRDTSQI